MTLAQQIARYVESNSDRLVQTLCDLIAFPSIVKVDPREAGPGERDCQLYLQQRLAALGMTTDLWDADGPALYAKYQGRPGANKGRTFEGRPNLGGVLRGSGGGRSIMLNGHVDVVPPGAAEHWHSDPFTPVVKEGAVYGRGSVDMKGGVACMLMALTFLQELKVPLAGDVVFTTVVDEEIGGMGFAGYGRPGFQGRCRDHDRADRQPYCADLSRRPVGKDCAGGHRRSRGADPELVGRQRPGGCDCAVSTDAGRDRYSQSPLAVRSA